MNLDFNEIFNILNTNSNNTIIIIAFLSLCVLAVVLRIVVCVGYQSAYAFFKLNAKVLKARSEIKKDARFGLLNKAITDYIRVAEKNVAAINTKTIINKHILKMNFLGWSYYSIERFINGIEFGSIAIGLVLSLVFVDFKFVYGLAAVSTFVLMRLFASIFDFRLTREKLLEETTEYIEREIGQFFAGDMGSILLRLKNDITTSTDAQTRALAGSMDRMGKDLTGMLQLAIQEMNVNIDKSIQKIATYGDSIKSPIENWAATLKTAESLQTQINGASENLGGTIKSLRTEFDSLGKGYTEQSEEIKRQIELLNQVVASVNNTGTSMLENNNVIEKQLKYIERNQNALESSLQHYELALENVTQTIGSGFGSIVEFHMQQSYNSLNDSVIKNINKIINSNNELIERLQELFNSLIEQSRSETQAILKIKEQMDLHYDS